MAADIGLRADTAPLAQTDTSPPLEMPVPTMDRRGGRSLKSPPDAPAGDGSDSDADPSEGDQEELGQELVDGAAETLATPEGKDELETALAGKPPEEQSATEAQSAQAASDEITQGDALEIEVVEAAPGETTTAVTKDGTVVDVSLEDGESSRVIDVSGEGKVLVLADDLSAEEVVQETEIAVTEAIEEVAINHGLSYDLGAIRDLIRGVYQDLRKQHDGVFVVGRYGSNLVTKRIDQGFLNHPERIRNSNTNS